MRPRVVNARDDAMQNRKRHATSRYLTLNITKSAERTRNRLSSCRLYVFQITRCFAMRMVVSVVTGDCGNGADVVLP